MMRSVFRLFVFSILVAAGFSLGGCASSGNADGGGHAAAKHDADAQTVWGSTERNPAKPIDGPTQDHHAGQ